MHHLHNLLNLLLGPELPRQEEVAVRRDCSWTLRHPVHKKQLQHLYLITVATLLLPAIDSSWVEAGIAPAKEHTSVWA